MDWPPTYGPPDAHGPTPAPSGGFPPAGWPSKDQLDYIQKAVTALVLVLALPWLVVKLLTQPEAVFAGAAKKHVGTP